jgi:type I restriction enzyme R subunit
MKAFINSRFFDLDPEEDIIKEYEQYEKQVMENYVVEFAAANGVAPSLVFSILNEYFVDERSITKNKIRERLTDMHLPLLKLTKLINAIMTFIKNMYDKFTIEGV